MYVIIHKKRVIAGILPWNNRYFMEVLKVRHRIDVQLPKNEPSIDQFPYTIDEDTIIMPAREIRDGNINPMVEFYQGPLWKFEEKEVLGIYEILPLDLESAKNNYKNRAANMRYVREISGITTTINDNEYKISTNREDRVKYIEKQISVESEEPVVWKFAEGWETLTKEDFSNIVKEIDTYVQSQFDWEYQQSKLIESCNSLEELLELEELNAQDNEQQQDQLGGMLGE